MGNWIGIDIGGANLKAADAEGWTVRHPFSLWKYPEKLPSTLLHLLSNAPAFDAVALTMTGEMADCFATREEGVVRILESVTSILPSPIIRVYTTKGEWLNVPAAARNAWSVASSNWRALSQYVLRWTRNDNALLLDIGSTTCDLIALDGKRQKVLTTCCTDSDRLRSGELVYTGCDRSSVQGISRYVTVQGIQRRVINEHFATAADVHLTLGHIEPQLSNRDTADGKPLDRQHAAFRLARCIGEDGDTLSKQDVMQIAESIYETQISEIASAALKVIEEHPRKKFRLVIASGHANYMVEDVIEKLSTTTSVEYELESLSTLISPACSAVGPAFAIAVLATESNISFEPNSDVL